ncbi:MAG: hypothetical protein IE909_13940 [Campylobacterales bacterium]|nr:hypothetical protein [Campylobacterales bacterium]
MLDHNENFELEKEYEQIWDSIRYKKVDELYELTEEVIKILENHIDDKLLFHSDYEKIQHLFRKMKQKNFFYMSGSAKEIIKSANPKFKNVYEYRECVRELKYVGSGDKDFENGKIYQSVSFNGVAYKINVDGNERTVGSSYFERIS